LNKKGNLKLHNSTIIEFDNVSYSVAGKKINKNISFKINNGDLLSIVGPNGSGKTTMIRMMSGELKPTAGTIKFEGKKIINWDTKDLACKRAILSQSNNLSFPFSVYDVICMGRYPVSEYEYLEDSSEQSIIKYVIDCFDLKEFKDRNYLTLSGGERQRVQLARIFAQIWSKNNYNDKLIILDEPTSFLDIYHQIQLYELIIKLNKKGLTVVMVLHDINHALMYSNEVMMIKDSALKYFGKVNETINKNSIQEIFNVEYGDYFYKTKI
tara:strand:- start:2946 stop:3749 length:804 start_codon:yes stop_codon:yes gene_type:complete